MVNKSLFDEEVKSESLRKNMEILGQSIISPGGPRIIRPQNMIRYAGYLRDTLIWKMPILPGAIEVFQQLSSGREWQVVGKLRPALRAVEWLNNTKTVDINTGFVTRGFEDYLKRRSLDFAAVGRLTSHVDYSKNKAEGELEYLDPTSLIFQRQSGFTNQTREVPPKEKVWLYADNRTFKAEDIFISHTLPIGGSGLFISPLAFVMPTALLAWLVREHDTASTDGRRIRDIIIVGSAELAASIEEAVLTQLALHAGGDPSKLGIPIVEMNNLSGTSIADQITTLGLSKIPEGFKREEFDFDYVNQISAALGLSLRHFWNSERTTNRALEEIQEQRQLQKGPSSFVRSEERLINQSGVLKPFSTGRSRIQFNFIEEVDTGSALNNAMVLKATTEALEKVATVFQAGLSLESLLSWMQSIHVLPNDLELITPGGTSPNPTAVNPNASPTPQPDEQIIAEDQQPPATSAGKSELMALYNKYTSTVPDYDEVSVDSHGNVRERRVKVYSVKKAIIQELKSNPDFEDEPIESDEDAYESAIELQQLNNREAIKHIFFDTKRELTAEVTKRIPMYSLDEMNSTIYKVIDGQTLTETEQTIVDLLVDELDS